MCSDRLRHCERTRIPTMFNLQLNVRTKLFGSFGVVVALLLGLGVFAITKMGSINSSTIYLGTNAVPSIHALGDLKNDTGKLRRDQLQVATAPDAEQFKSHVADVAD